MRTLNIEEHNIITGGVYTAVGEKEIEDVGNSLGLGTWSTLFVIGALQGVVVVLMDHFLNTPNCRSHL